MFVLSSLHCFDVAAVCCYFSFSILILPLLNFQLASTLLYLICVVVVCFDLSLILSDIIIVASFCLFLFFFSFPLLLFSSFYTTLFFFNDIYNDFLLR